MKYIVFFLSLSISLVFHQLNFADKQGDSNTKKIENLQKQLDKLKKTTLKPSVNIDSFSKHFRFSGDVLIGGYTEKNPVFSFATKMLQILCCRTGPIILVHFGGFWRDFGYLGDLVGLCYG